MTNAVLCVDIGTTSLKAGLITARGEVVSFCSIPFEDSQNEFTASSWLGAFVKAVCKLEVLCAQAGQSASVNTISISGNGPTVVADCGYTVFWNEDTSDAKIPDSADAKKSLFMPKLLALKKRAPKIYKKSRFIFSGPEYLIYILTGEAVTILPEERFRAAYWNDEVCAVCGIDSEKLPPFIGIGDCCGPVHKEVLAELRNGTRHNLNISQNCSVFAGGPDFVAALIGTGTLMSGQLCDRCGSSEGLNFCTDKILKGEGLRILPSVIPGLWNASYLIPNSGELSENERLAELERGIGLLKQAASEAGIRFTDEMAVTGGQTNDELLLREKNKRLGMKILRPAGGHFVHSELLGDACAAWFGLGEYDSLQSAAENIVRLEPYENL
jgi:sugar (pentulose or hexulose) kinase